MTTAPPDAVAIDVPCPICSERPIEQAATAYRVTGFLLTCQIKTQTHVGCGRCTRRKCWRTALHTAVTGWWSLPCLVLNPLAIGWNLGRGLYNRGPSDGLVSTLERARVPVSFLDDSDDFQGDDPHDNVLVRGLVQVGCAVMLADGDADQIEIDVIRDFLVEMVEGTDETELVALIEETARSDIAIADVSAALGVLLPFWGRDAALVLAVRVASIDGEIDDWQIALAIGLGHELDRPVDADEIEMKVVINRILYVEGDELYVGVDEADLEEFD